MPQVALAENIAAPTEKSDEAEDALEELIAEFGLRMVISALLRTEAAQYLEAANPQATLRVLRFLLREIVYSTDPQLEAEIMAIGAGVLDDSGIVTRIAEKHGLTRSAISKRVVEFCTEWNLPPSGAMKSEAARRVYAIRNQPRLS